MVFTVEKLQRSLRTFSRVVEGPPHQLTPVYSSVATGAMTFPTHETEWHEVQVGKEWGVRHGTSWLKATFKASREMQGQPVVLQLHWETPGDDALFLRLEATVFLDGRAIGAFDWRHPVLLLPDEASDGQAHKLLLQVYTGVPQPFGGLTLSVRNTLLWQTYHLMETLLDVCLTLHDEDPARHELLHHLNIAYNMLDLREGWQSELLVTSAQEAYDYLQMYLEKTHDSGRRPQITVSGHAHLDVA